MNDVERNMNDDVTAEWQPIRTLKAGHVSLGEPWWLLWGTSEPKPLRYGRSG